MIINSTYDQLRRKIGQILGLAISKGAYAEKIKSVDLAGRITPRETKNILVAILEWIDQEEDKESGQPQSDGDDPSFQS